ncbi:DNA topoisomerase 3-alpha [Mactra antiquata]
MVKVLNVAEKNDAAKSIAEVMSRGRFNRREGFSKFNKIYEYEYMLFNQKCNMMMTSVSGHLLGLEFIGQYRKWNSCSPVTLFDVQVEKYCPENFKDIKRTLEKEVRGAQHLIIWTDCDREGENIGFEIIQVCKAVKPNIQVYRAKFSEITPQAIARACQNLQIPDKNVSDAVDVRSELDLRIGAAFTRFQTKRLQKIFPNVLADQLISYGSCQFPTLGFVVERYKQVQAFIPEMFWKLKVIHKMDDTNVEFSWKRNRLFDYMACFVLYTHCLEAPLAKVIDTKGKSKSKWRPVALDTVELEKLASRKLRISAKETMKIAEKLYTNGFISYPRTETNMFTKEIDLATLVQHQTVDPNWGEFAGRVLERGPTPRNGNKTDNAHPPIHPTKYTNNLQGNEKKLYEFIVRHFLACCSQDAQGFETTVEIDINQERFVAQGLMVTAKNYLEVYTYEKWSGKEIPVFEKGDEFEPSAIEMNNGETTPPPLLSEADLIALMDKHGIGTDATHAEHIETIKSRSYVGVRPDGRLIPGQLGMGLVEGYDAMGYEMSKPHLRAELEADLKRICEGTKQKNAVLEAQVKKYKEVFIEACRQAEKIDESLSVYLGENAEPAPAEDEIAMNSSTAVMKCPMCGSDMLLRPKKDNKGYYIGCMGFPNCRCAIWLPDGVINASVSDNTCDKCGPDFHLVNFEFKRGSMPPTVPTEYCGCVAGCDPLLADEVGIRPPRTQGQQTQTGSAQSQAFRDSGYGSTQNTSIGSVSSRSFSTQASVSPRNFTTNVSAQSSRNSNTSNIRTSYHSDNNNRNSRNNMNTSQNNLTQRTNNWSNQNSNNTNDFRTPLGIVNTNSRTTDSSDSGNAVVCNCGNDAIQLTVRKEGPNTGRQFYKCGSSSCGFFLWSDEASNDGSDTSTVNRSSSSSYSSNRYQYNNNTSQQTSNYNRNRNNDQNQSVSCQCGQMAKNLTVQKEGPNKGRQFYACPAPRGEGCNFFQWADEDSSGTGYKQGGRGKDFTQSWGQGSVGRGGKKRSATSDGEVPAKKGKKCGLCGIEGHTKRTCPHK